MKTIFRLGVLVLLIPIVTSAWSNPSDIVWTDDVENNPVIGSPGFGDNRAYYGQVIFDPIANIWRAWYDSSSGYDVGYAESTDSEGINWTNYAPVTGFTTSRQSKAVVLQIEDSLFRMWYMADERDQGYSVYTAVSSDGINWGDDQIIEGIVYDNLGSSQWGPVERIAVTQLEDGTFTAYCRCEEPFLDAALEWFDQGKKLFRYTSEDGINWTWGGYTGVNEIEGFESLEFSSVVKHPDIEDVWYAWGSMANSERPIYSFVSTDDGLTFELDEDPVANVGDYQTQPYNQNRNFHASVTYLGNGEWVMFRSTADPKTTSRATGIEEISSPIDHWYLY